MTKKMILFGRITGLLKVYFEKEEIYIWLTHKNSNITVNDNAEYRFAIQSYFLWLTKKQAVWFAAANKRFQVFWLFFLGSLERLRKFVLERYHCDSKPKQNNWTFLL